MLGIWIGHGEEVDEDHMVTLQIVLTTVDNEWIFVPRLAPAADEHRGRAAGRCRAAGVGEGGGAVGVTRRAPAPNRGTDLLMLS